MKIKHYQPLTYITYSIVGITVLAGILLSCNIPIFPGISVNGSTLATTQTQTTSTNAAIRVRSTCSMTATIDSGNEHAATMINGQYKEDIGLTTIQTFCNDPNGYAIYAIGYTGGDTGVAAGTNTVLHSTALGSTYDIVTGIATSGDISNWAMKLASVDGTYKPDILNGYDSYSLVPQNYTKIAYYNTNTDLDNPASTRQGSKLTTTYAAYISPTQDAGTYEGAVKYILLHPSGIEHYPYLMQEVNTWGSSVEVGEEVIAYDSRDNKSYTVRRMCMDGNGSTWQDKEFSCNSSMLWMTQNLDLDLDSATTLTSGDTDLRDGSLTGSYSNGYTVDSDGIIYWTPANSTITSIDTANGKFNGWINNNSVVYSADPKGGDVDNSWYATGDPYNSNLCNASTGGNQTCNYLKASNTVAPIYFQRIPFTANGSHGKIGNYYNWTAAIASNYSRSSASSTYNNIANNPQNSICPRGWRLPTVSSVAGKSEFALLNDTYNGGSASDGANLLNSPVYMVRSGYISNGNLYEAGHTGYYWSSTVSSTGFAYDLSFLSSRVRTASADGRAYGYSIRCVSDY